MNPWPAFNGQLNLLPPLGICEELHLDVGEVVIHAPGFEDRTLALSQLLSPSPRSRAILLDYRPETGTNRFDDVRSMLVAKGVVIEQDDKVVYDRFNPDGFEAALETRLRLIGASRVILDISTMSKLAIMLVMDVCRRLRIAVRVFYAEAREYGPSQKEFEVARARGEIHRPTLQVFTGVHGVVRASALSSVAMQGQPTAALVFMSFNDALTQVLLNTVYPSRLFLINGRPPALKWRESATAWIHEQVRREWEADNPLTTDQTGQRLPERVVSTLDYRETVGLINRLYWDLSVDHRVLLAPSGSKFQALGCAVIKAMYPDIHIEYPSPEGFAREYSSGVERNWLVDFGLLDSLICKLVDAERETYLAV